uniref:Secreted protein n=1 Tax=Echinococcus granulosus TaxID=6210 RepID=A0A068WYR3_ECHGR|nr:hypothetical protein EgrG_002053700 [Echinococcus granulosus]
MVGSWVFLYCTDCVAMADAGGWPEGAPGMRLKRGERLCNTTVVYPSVLVRVELFTWLNWVLHDFITHPPLFDFRFGSRDSAKVDVAVGLRDRADVSPNAHVRVLSTVLYVVDLVRRARDRIITERFVSVYSARQQLHDLFLEKIGIPWKVGCQ